MVGEFLKFGDGAFYDNHFEAVMMVKVDVRRGDRLQYMTVLEFEQLSRQVGGMVVIHKKDSRDGLGLRFFKLFLRQPLTDKITHGLRAIGVPLLFDEFVK